ncbi:MAG: DUF4136 domain-containing protein [Myxococcota bacterium]|nr:DUF4136 domain-containing protein [Myxococcota bacterium]
MKTAPALAVVAGSVVALLAAACSSVRTSYDFDPGIDFSTWRAYAWYPRGQAPTGDVRLDNDLFRNRIVAAVDRTLAARGFTRVEGREPEFYVDYHLSTQERLSVQTMNRGWAMGPHGAHWGRAGWGGVGWTDTHVDQYEEGTLVIDFADASARRLAWRGSGTRRLSRNPRPEQITQRVNEAVDEILAQFPPQ